jgi:CubicO group peptidase (beta-lactamase class C family)
MIAKRLGSKPELDFVPGTKEAYSNLGYLVLGRIVERVSGMRFETYVERNVLSPLGCRGSGFSVPADRATGYQRTWSLSGLASRVLLDSRFFSGTIGRLQGTAAVHG